MNTTLRTKLYTAIGCVIGAAAITALTIVAGADDLTAPAITVKFDDLNIASPAGAKALYRRIQVAAVEVCPQADNGDLHMVAIKSACVEHAIDDAVRKVDSTALTDLRFGSPVRLASK
jgi:UrcA family protein